jgi:hypothetical protein
MTRWIHTYFTAKGQATVSGYYADPTTHLSTTGANIVAQLVRDEEAQHLSAGVLPPLVEARPTSGR